MSGNARQAIAGNDAIIALSTHKIVALLASAAVALLLIHFAFLLGKHLFGWDDGYGLSGRFHFDGENNIPATFSAILLLLASPLFWVIGAQKRYAGEPRSGYWKALSVVFVYLSFDEAARIHELLGRPAREMLNCQRDACFLPAWTILAIPIVVISALLFLRWFLHLPMKLRVRVFIAAAVYLGGAVGGEITGLYARRWYGAGSFVYDVCATVEESLEMAGVIYFIHVLLTYLQEDAGEARFRFVR
jgi:hypothetical protein